jgi:hypothetical protein
MIQVEARTLKQGDVIRFDKDSQYQHTVKDRQTHSWEHSLVGLDFEGERPSRVTMPQTGLVWAVEQWRDTSIPCSGPECDATQTIRVNRAALNGPDISMVCSGCRVKAVGELIGRQCEEAKTNQEIRDAGGTP